MFAPVSEGVGIDLDEASTVDENLGPHVTHGDQLGAVLQTAVVLLQHLQQVVAFAWPQTTHKLDEWCGVGKGH